MSQDPNLALHTLSKWGGGGLNEAGGLSHITPGQNFFLDNLMEKVEKQPIKFIYRETISWTSHEGCEALALFFVRSQCEHYGSVSSSTVLMLSVDI